MKIILAAVLAAAVIAPAAHAQTVPTVTVAYGDLNVDSQAGQAALKARLVRAARTVCGGSTSADLSERMARIACYKTALAGAMTQVPAHGPQFASR